MIHKLHMWSRVYIYKMYVIYLITFTFISIYICIHTLPSITLLQYNNICIYIHFTLYFIHWAYKCPWIAQQVLVQSASVPMPVQARLRYHQSECCLKRTSHATGPTGHHNIWHTSCCKKSRSQLRNFVVRPLQHLQHKISWRRTLPNDCSWHGTVQIDAITAQNCKLALWHCITCHWILAIEGEKGYHPRCESGRWEYSCHPQTHSSSETSAIRQVAERFAM